MTERAATVAALIALSAVVAGCDDRTGAGNPTATSGTTSTIATGTVPDGLELVTAALTAPGADGVELALWHAATPDQWHRGLTGVTDLGSANGMLFEFDREANQRFHMWQTPVPLDIYFFDSHGALVGMREMVPCLDRTSSGCERYSPGVPFLSAIEVPAGSLDLDLDETWAITYEPLRAPEGSAPD